MEIKIRRPTEIPVVYRARWETLYKLKCGMKTRIEPWRRDTQQNPARSGGGHAESPNDIDP